MAATTYSTLPSNTYGGLPTQPDQYRTGSHETYGSNIESLTSHPYQSSYGNNMPDRRQPLSHPTAGYPTQPSQQMPTNRYEPLPMDTRMHERSIATNNNSYDLNHTTMSTTYLANMRTKEHLPQPMKHQQQQNSQPIPVPQQPPGPVGKPKPSGDPTLVRSERQLWNSPPAKPQPTTTRKPAPPVNPPRAEKPTSTRTMSPPDARQRSLSNHNRSHASDPPPKPAPPPREQKLNKSTVMRAAAIKKLEQKREQKRTNAFFPVTENKALANKLKAAQTSPESDAEPSQSGKVPRKKKTLNAHSHDQHHQTDGEQSETEKIRPKKKQPHSVPNARKSNAETDGEHSEAERSKPKKKPAVPSHLHQQNRQSEGEQSEAEHIKPKKKPVGPSRPLPQNRQSEGEQSETEKGKPNKKKSQSVPKPRKTNAHADGEHSDVEKGKPKKNEPHGKPKQHVSRRDDYQTDHHETSDDDDDHHRRQRSKSQKRTDKQPHFPPIRRTRGGPAHQEPDVEAHLPPGHPMRGRHPYYDEFSSYGPYPGRYDYRPRHLYEDAYDVPPYLAPYHDAYDGFFDYEKRKQQKPKRRKDKNVSRTDHEDNGAATGNETEREEDSKSRLSRKSRNKNHPQKQDGRKSRNKNHPQKQDGRKSRPENDESRRSQAHPHPYYPPDMFDGHDVLDLWRQERNDYLKKKFKPTIHDVLYSQQWMKADSYLENQRRRHLRDSQGYYFPYKKYTLKDYKDLQKLNNQNPFAEVQEPIIDRKERARKRQEYGLQVERQAADNPGMRQVSPRDMPPRKPWHLSHGEPQDPEQASKRERALEYAKVQIKYRPVNGSKDSLDEPDSSRGYEHDYSPPMNDAHDESTQERPSRINQSYDDYYE